MASNQIALLEQGRQAHVAGQHAGKQQMPDGHRGRRPKCDRPADVERMPHVLVQRRHAKRQRFILTATQVATRPAACRTDRNG